MDGTLLDSTAAMTQVFTKYCADQGLRADEFFSKAHGRRNKDTIKLFNKVPKAGSDMTEGELIAEAQRLDNEIIIMAERMKASGGEGIVRLPGVERLLAKLREGGARWAIVTSATSDYAAQALAICGITPPALPPLISADMCMHGKPHPEPYLTGLATINALSAPVSVAPVTPLRPEDVLVLEDSPAGIESGSNAGCFTLAVCTSKPPEVIKKTPATYRVLNLDRVEVVKASWEGITLSIKTLEEEE